MEPLSRILVAALAVMALAACSAAGDGVVVQTTDDTGAPGHPLVPGEYAYYWNTGACTDAAGQPGVQAYWLADTGTADPAGNLTVTERWFWFFGEADYAGDCVDTFTLTGTTDPDTDRAALGCSSCDATWAVERRVAGDTCARDYTAQFGASSDGAFSEYLLLDAVSESGTYNAENALLVVVAREDDSGWAVQHDYALGHAFPQGDEPWPASVDWLGSVCVPLDGA